jgi:hypothetical protein
VPGAVKSLIALDTLPASTGLNLSIGLPLHNPDLLTNLLEQLYDPTSPLYHQYLTPEEFAARFCPTEKDYQALIDFIRSRGLTVIGRHPKRLVLDVYGTAYDIEAAFATKLKVYPHPKENRKFFAPAVEPSIETGLAILDISGLDNYLVPRPARSNRRQFRGRPFPMLVPDRAVPTGETIFERLIFLVWRFPAADRVLVWCSLMGTTQVISRRMSLNRDFRMFLCRTFC